MWITSRAVTTRKMITLTFRRVLERSMSDDFVLEMNVAPVIPTATAAMRATRMRRLLEMILDSGYFTGFPLKSSLQDNGHGLNSFVNMTAEECGLPVEDEGIRRVQQTEETNAVDDRFSNHQVHIRSRTIRACEGRTHYKRGHSD